MASLPRLGDLTEDPRSTGVWVSRPIPVPFFGGRPLPFELVASDRVDPWAAPDVATAVASFLELGDSDRLAMSERVHDNYRTFLDVADIDPLDIATAVEVWRFVSPNAVRVDRRSKDQQVYLLVDCECEWEVEHGLQIVFKHGDLLVRVSEQDGHFTHADATGLPDES